MTPIELFNENKNIVYSIYNKEFTNHTELKDDLIQVGLIALWKSANKFDPNRGVKFSTFAYRSIENNMKCFSVRSYKKTCCVLSLSEPVGDGESSYEEVLASPVNFEDSVEIDEIFHQLFKELDEQQKSVIQAVIDGYKKTEISQIMNLSKAKITKILKDFRKKLQNTLLLSD